MTTQCPLMAKKEIVALAGLVSFLKVGKQVKAPKEKTLNWYRYGLQGFEPQGLISICHLGSQVGWSIRNGESANVFLLKCNMCFFLSLYIFNSENIYEWVCELIKNWWNQPCFLLKCNMFSFLSFYVQWENINEFVEKLIRVGFLFFNFLCFLFFKHRIKTNV